MRPTKLNPAPVATGSGADSTEENEPPYFLPKTIKRKGVCWIHFDCDGREVRFDKEPSDAPSLRVERGDNGFEYTRTWNKPSPYFSYPPVLCPISPPGNGWKQYDIGASRDFTSWRRRARA